MPLLFDEPLGRMPADVIHDAGMPASEARAMLLVAKVMGITSAYLDNKNGTFDITVYTGTPETSDLFWARTDRLTNLFGIKPVIESIEARIKGERSRS